MKSAIALLARMLKLAVGTFTAGNFLKTDANGFAVDSGINANTAIPESQVTNLVGDLATLTAGIVASVPTSRLISTTAPLTGGGDLTANRTFAIPAATSSVDGYLKAVDWVTFNGKGSGTVTSVGMTVPSWLSVANSPITGAGTLALTAVTGQTQNQVLATPNGSAGALSVRALVAGDIPNLDAGKITTGTVAVARLPAGTSAWPFNQLLNSTNSPTFVNVILTTPKLIFSVGQIAAADGPDDNTAATGMTIKAGKGADGDGAISNYGSVGADTHVTAGAGGNAFTGGGVTGGPGGTVYITPGTGGTNDGGGNAASGTVQIQGDTTITGVLTATLPESSITNLVTDLAAKMTGSNNLSELTNIQTARQKLDTDAARTSFLLLVAGAF